MNKAKPITAWTRQTKLTEVAVQQTDDFLDSMSCTGSSFCAEVCPEVFEFDEEKERCQIRGGACVVIGGVEFSKGDLAPGSAEAAVGALIECDSAAVYLTDTEGNVYRQQRSGE